MRLFVTGASGHIGSAVVPDLLAAGHTVVGLARSDASAAVADGRRRRGPARLARRPRRPPRGGAERRRRDPSRLQARADLCRRVRPRRRRRPARDRGDRRRARRFGQTVRDHVGHGAAGHGGAGPLGIETAVLERGPRVDSENTVVAMAARGVRSSVVRLPPTVHSSLDHHGFVPTLIAMARKNGVSVYVGDGANRWPAVHTLDAARLYRLAVESAPAGARLHGVAEQGVPFRQIAEAIGRGLGLPAASVTPDEAARVPRVSRPCSRRSTIPRPAPRHARCCNGSRRTQGCSRISRSATISSRLRRLDSDEGVQGMSTRSVPAPGGTCPIGDREVARVGYGAMQLAGPGVFGPPKDRDAARLRCCARRSRAASTTSTPATTTARTSPTRSSARRCIPIRDDLVIVTKVGARRGAGRLVDSRRSRQAT